MRSGMPPSVSPATQMNKATGSSSVIARNRMKPRPMRHYWLAPKDLDIGRLVAAAPHREDDVGIGGILLDAPPQALHQRIDAALGHEGVIRPHARQQRFAAEDDARVRREHVQQSKF